MVPFRQKHESECYVIDRLFGTIAEWSAYCAVLDAVGGLCVVTNSTKNFALINQTLSSNLGSRTPRAENKGSGFFWANIADMLYIGRILPMCYFGNIATFIGRFLVFRENVVFCWKMKSKAAIQWQAPFFQSRCATVQGCNHPWLGYDLLQAMHVEDTMNHRVLVHFSAYWSIFPEKLLTIVVIEVHTWNHPWFDGAVFEKLFVTEDFI